MTMHSSLKRAGKSGKFRCVLSRWERIQLLQEKGEWSEGSSVVGLPKVKVVKMKTSKKEKSTDEKKDEAGASKKA
jgi:small basic protein (TIGR04137 family)